VSNLTANPLPQLIRDFFQQWLRSQRRLSPATIASYRDGVRLLLNFVTQINGRPASQQRFEDVDAPVILQFLDHLESDRGNQIRTRNARWAALQALMRYCAQQSPESLAVSGRVLAIPSKRFERPLLGYLCLEELQAVVQAPAEQTWSGRRDRLLFALLYETGARVSEILALNQHDVHWSEGAWLCLHGKGRKERQVPLLKPVARQLKVWLRAQPAAPAAPLFTNTRGQRLTRFGVYHRLQLALQQARQSCPALQGRSISPHTFRHTCAMHLLQGGTALPGIALFLGHASTSTTHLYVEADLKMKRKTLEKLPLMDLRPGTFKPTDPVLAFLQSLPIMLSSSPEKPNEIASAKANST
jgi:integrase/recombinase XerD